MFETNLFGVIDMNQTFLPLLCKAQGTIVHVGTVGAIAPVPWLSVYTASKAALYAYCDTMRLEVATLGVKVVYVRTGQVATNPRTETPAVKDSVYASVRPNKKSHDDGLKQGCTPEAYANRVVGRLLRGGSWWRNSWVLWAGNQAFEMRVIGWIAGNLPWDLWGFLMRRAYKLG
jgi:1-acylglycerone phosphate reductase